MMTMFPDEMEKLKALPVSHTQTFKLDDREFTIVDSEFFYDICRRAGVTYKPAKESPL